MTAAAIVAIGMGIFADPGVTPVITAVVGVALFGAVTRGLRSFFA